MTIRKLINSILAFCLILTTPGLGTYQALAQLEISQNAEAAPKVLETAHVGINGGLIIAPLAATDGSNLSSMVQIENASPAKALAAAAIPAWNEIPKMEAVSRAGWDMENSRLVLHPSSILLEKAAAPAAGPAGVVMTPMAADKTDKSSGGSGGVNRKSDEPIISQNQSKTLVQAVERTAAEMGDRNSVTTGKERDPIQLDPNIRSNETIEFHKALRAKIVGQEEGVQALVNLFQVFTAGLNSPGRPIGNLLFLGPTGSGKTRLVEAAAEILFGDPRAVIKVDCAEFQHSHEIAKLIGSPPGYLGHRETHPLITQEGLAASHTAKLKLSFLLFDEIEKASDALWQLLLGMMDKATLTLGDNRRVDLSQTVIFLTSNLGGGKITEMRTGNPYYFAQTNESDSQKSKETSHEKIKNTAIEAARHNFSPEFMNRLDNVVVFHPLGREELDAILAIELGQVQKRVLDTATGKFLFRVTESARDFLLNEGTDQRYGARHLKRAIERYVTYPLANLLATHQVRMGDLIRIDWDGTKEKELNFVREQAGALVDVQPASAETSSEKESRKTRGGITADKGTPAPQLPQEARTGSVPAKQPPKVVFSGSAGSAQRNPYYITDPSVLSPAELKEFLDQLDETRRIHQNQGKGWSIELTPVPFQRQGLQSSTIRTTWHSDAPLEITIEYPPNTFATRNFIVGSNSMERSALQADSKVTSSRKLVISPKEFRKLFPPDTKREIVADFNRKLNKLVGPDTPPKPLIAR